MLSEHMVSLYFFLLPQRCRLEFKHPAFLMAEPRITGVVPLSLSSFNTAAGCNPIFASAKPLSSRWASWRAVGGSTKQEGI